MNQNVGKLSSAKKGPLNYVRHLDDMALPLVRGILTTTFKVL